MTTRIRAQFDLGNGHIEARNERDHVVVMAADKPHGDEEGFGPKSTTLASLAGCTAVDVVSILRKKRQRIDRYEIAVEAEAATDYPKVYTHITVEHRVKGRVQPEALRRAVELSATTYCPVSAMLSASVEIEHRYRLTDASGGESSALVATTGPSGTRTP